MYSILKFKRGETRKIAIPPTINYTYGFRAKTAPHEGWSYLCINAQTLSPDGLQISYAIWFAFLSLIVVIP